MDIVDVRREAAQLREDLKARIESFVALTGVTPSHIGVELMSTQEIGHLSPKYVVRNVLVEIKL
jgi:hypothetical protein